MALRSGFQDLDSIVRGLVAAGGAAGVAGASEMFANAKQNLKASAPVGKDKRSVHFADPRIAGGRIRRGGRTRRTVNFAEPRVTVLGTGATNSSARIMLSARAVMAPQGLYQNAPKKVRLIRPVRKKYLGWIVGGNTGIWTKSSLSDVGGGHLGWIQQALARPVSAGFRVKTAFANQFTGGRITPRLSNVLNRGFLDTAGTGDWYGENQPRSAMKDLALRRSLQASSRRAVAVWANQLTGIIARLR